MNRFSLLVVLIGLFFRASAAGETWVVPLAGNAYVTQPGGPDKVRGPGIHWENPTTVFSVYVYVDRASELKLALNLKVPTGESKIKMTVAGRSFEKTVSGSDFHVVEFGSIRQKEAGYVRVDLQGLEKAGSVFAEVDQLLVTSKAEGVTPHFVKDNEGNRFYWGRRGPSIHLGYEMPKDRTISYAYSELTVPEGQDPIGSYFMANGFGEGYFGIQVNGPEERRVLFSVWSPFATDDPSAIPEDHRTIVLKKGRDVHTGEFGNEGSGGQSFLRFPWKAGTTYRFLNAVQPDGKGSTDYTAWFYTPETKAWQLIASFKRPQTDKHLTGFHGFLENFADTQGFRSRGARYGNQWVYDTEGQWHELTRARFTGDDIASRKYRVDYAGGATGKAFFLRNGGFFDEGVALNQWFERSASGRAPVIDFSKLE